MTTKALESDRLNLIRSETEHRIESVLSKTKYELTDYFKKAITEAYRQGIRDGFVQGITAESKVVEAE